MPSCPIHKVEFCCPRCEAAANGRKGGFANTPKQKEARKIFVVRDPAILAERGRLGGRAKEANKQKARSIAPASSGPGGAESGDQSTSSQS